MGTGTGGIPTTDNIPETTEKLKTKDEFWLDKKAKFSNLFKLYLRFSSIPASSAFIERFFSICGVVCKQRAGNSLDDLLITRSFLKCNIEILNELKNL